MKLKLIVILFLGFTEIHSQASPNYSINGVFIHNQTKYLENNQLKNNNSVAAFFTYTPALVINPSAFSQVSRVRFNNKKLKFKNSGNFYSKLERIPHNTNGDDDDDDNEECNGIDLNIKHWTVTGLSSIPNMNFIYNGVLPSFNTTTGLLKDSVRKGDTLFITLNNIQNTDSIMITIVDDRQLQTPHQVAFLAPNYTNKYYIIPSVLIPLTVGPRAYIKVEAINYNYQTIAGKQYLFRNIFGFTRANILILN